MKNTFNGSVEPSRGDIIREIYNNSDGTVINRYSFYSYNTRPDYIDVLTFEGSRISLPIENCTVLHNRTYLPIKPIESRDHK